MGIFDKRLNYKPFEYPEILQFVDSMNQTFWVHKEVEFTADIQDFKSNLSERSCEEKFAEYSTGRSSREDFLGGLIQISTKTRI